MSAIYVDATGRASLLLTGAMADVAAMAVGGQGDNFFEYFCGEV